MKKILLIGAGGHTKSCIEVIEQEGKFNIAGLVSREIKLNDTKYPVIGEDKDLNKLFESIKNAIVTIGQIKEPANRIKTFEKILSIGFDIPYIVSPSAYVSNTSKIMMGTFIMMNTIINANVKIGKNCIINNKALIEHDSLIGDHCHISTGAIINGGVTIGNNTFIGSGVITKEGIKIGNNCIIGVGSIIKNDIPDNEIIRS
tara:strand:- start:3376 stop:3981 length:606 start_codon:yes stop_codon:yes gene_type:complete